MPAVVSKRESVPGWAVLPAVLAILPGEGQSGKQPEGRDHEQGVFRAHQARAVGQHKQAAGPPQPGHGESRHDGLQRGRVLVWPPAPRSSLLLFLGASRAGLSSPAQSPRVLQGSQEGGGCPRASAAARRGERCTVHADGVYGMHRAPVSKAQWTRALPVVVRGRGRRGRLEDREPQARRQPAAAAPGGSWILRFRPGSEQDRWLQPLAECSWRTIPGAATGSAGT